MALTNDDLDRIDERFAARIGTELHPLRTSVEILNLTAFGAQGNNGLRKSVKDLEKWRYYVTGALFVIGSATFWKILSTP